MEKNTRRKAAPLGAVIYRGPSLFDGAPIVAILTGIARPSSNTKTGPMAQLWILLESDNPFSAVTTGRDSSICGTCNFRNMGGCYVNVAKAPSNIWKAYTGGAYPMIAGAEAIAALGAGRRVRLGAYGDPAAMPAGILRAVISKARKHTGYTHAWRVSQDLSAFLMASVDSETERIEAKSAGWRTFRVAPKTTTAPNTDGEIICPNVTRGVNCYDCGLCNGAGSAADIVIPAHGMRASRIK